MAKLAFDPRTKTILFFVACVYSYSVTAFLPLIAIVFFVNAILFASGKAGVAIKLFLFYTALHASWYVVSKIESNAITLALMIILGVIRMFMPSIMAFLMLFLTTKISEFMSAFEKMHIPNLIMIPIVVMVRFIPTVKEEWNGISDAMAYRGINLSACGVLLHPLQTAEYVLVPLLFSCVHIMDELVAASMVRGLESDKKRACYFDMKLGIWDYIALLICLVFVALLFWI